MEEVLGWRRIGGQSVRYWRVVILFFLIAGAFHYSVAIVFTKFGPVRGVFSRTVRGNLIAQYLGVPYAEAPVGDLRFRNPQPWTKLWNATFDAVKDSPACIQVDQLGKLLGEEDCLFLNVYVPMLTERQRVSDNLPVMVFVRGGAYAFGSSNSFNIPPTYMLDQKLILVTMNYRLHTLGFFSTGNKVSPGNYALKDVVMSLRWVKENIHSFGGNPDSVTLWGHSAGSTLVHALALTNKTEGLFNQYIIQSGPIVAPWSYQPRQWIRWASLKVAKNAGCLPQRNSSGENVTVAIDVNKYSYTTEEPIVEDEIERLLKTDDYSEQEDEEIMQCLRSLPANELSNATNDFYVWRDYPCCQLGPTVEEESEEAILTMHPLTALQNGMFRDIPFIIGMTLSEGLIKTFGKLNKLVIMKLEPDFVDLVAKKQFIDHFEEYLPIYLEYNHVIYNNSGFANAIEEYYFQGNLTENFDTNITDVISDGFIVWPTYLTLKYQSNTMKSNIYFYVFSYMGTFSSIFDLGDTKRYNVTHTDDLNYLIPLLNQKYQNLMLHNTEADITMINIMTEMWANFAATGVPKAWDIVTWPNYNVCNEFLHFGNQSLPEVYIESNFPYDRMIFWDELMKNFSAYPSNDVELITRVHEIEEYREASNVTTCCKCNEFLFTLIILIICFYET